MKREVMLVAKNLRESDLPLMDRAFEAAKRDPGGAFVVCEVYQDHERSRAMQAIRLSGQFELRTVKAASTGRMRMVAVWLGK